MKEDDFLKVGDKVTIITPSCSTQPYNIGEKLVNKSAEVIWTQDFTDPIMQGICVLVDNANELTSAWSYFTGKEFIKQEKPKSLPRIFEQERVEFARLWHNYHQKHAIPYAHDERDEIFNSIVLIFREDKD